MGLGILLLVSIGKENLYLSGQAEITFFKLVYKQYTNFSIETIPQYFKTEPDFSRKITINISKNADLLDKLYLNISLPSISPSRHTYLPDGIKKFRWIEKIGLGIIKNIDLEIGGVLIDRINGEYMNFCYELNNKIGQQRGYNNMIGNIEEVKKYTNGKKSYNLQVPLNFWFCQDSGLALPLIALTHNDVKIHVEFSSFNKCYMESPSHYIKINNMFCLFQEGEIIQQEINGNIAIGKFVYFDIVERRLYYDKISNDFEIPLVTSSRYNILGRDSKFEVSIQVNTYVIKDESYFLYNFPSLETSFLLANYVYLDNKERWEFIHKDLEYMVPLVDIIPEKKVYSTNVSYKIDLINNPTKIIYWRGQLLSNYEANDIFNYTTSPIETSNSVDSSQHGVLINKVAIVINSINREPDTDYKFYRQMKIYKNNLSSAQDGIMLYSFALFPSEYQPSGTLNFNKIDDAYLQLTLNKIVNYQQPMLVKAYGVHLNIFRVINGLSSLVFI